MEQNEFEDLGKDIWARLLQTTWQPSDSYAERGGSQSYNKY
ncbi:MAG: hypothetical protein PHU34_08980 [Candidatus Methanoperedens sp.]|nr:hypothetical protein [Candidatus Methanoperedens sp.]